MCRRSLPAWSPSAHSLDHIGLGGGGALLLRTRDLKDEGDAAEYRVADDAGKSGVTGPWVARRPMKRCQLMPPPM